MNGLLATLEAFTQARIVANLQSFMDEISMPRALQRSWQLGKTGFGPGLTAKSRVGEVFERKAEESKPSSSITPHELEIARLAVAGKSNSEIAEAMALQLSTVKNTLSRIYAKLGVGGRMDLLRMAGEWDWL